MRNTAGGATTRRRRTCAALGAAALLFAGALPAAVGAEGDGFLGSASDLGVDVPATSGQLTSAHVTSPTGRWFVELAPQPTSRGGSELAVARAEQAVLAGAAKAGLDVVVERRYSTLWSGVSATVSDTDARALADVPGVAAVYPVLTVDAPDPAAFNEPELRTALAMTGADVAQSELGFTGEGIKVAVMDTGVDIDHPDLGGNGTPGSTSFPTERVVAGWDFVGDDYNADASSDGYQPVPHPDAVPDDCHGHGTHVAGIIGASGDFAADGVRGVAPGVQFGAYRVFGCDGSTTSDIMVEAMERALADGMDVLNMSIGSAFQTWPEYPTAVAGDNLVDAGVVVVASIGNSGASGTWSAGAPGVGEKVIGVASFENTHVTATTVVVDGQAVAYIPASNAPTPPTSGSLPLVALGSPGSATARGCAPIDPAVTTGNAVLVERGAVAAQPDCRAEFYYKALRAQEAGAAAVVLYNNVPGLFSPTVAPLDGGPAITIPVIAIGQAEGAALTAATADGATLTWTDETGQAVNPVGGLISSFSSYGLAADLSLKPDLGAPGGNIYSTYPLEKNGYATSSGTSMSAPHVAGAVALLLQAHPDTATAQVRDVLQNTAAPAGWSLVPGGPYIEPVHRQGAGLMMIDKAITADTRVLPGKLSLGESENGPVTRTLTFTNSGDADVTYSTSVLDAITTADSVELGGDRFTPDDPGFFLPGNLVEMPATVTVPAGGTVDVEVTIAPDPELEELLALYGGYLVFEAEGATTLRVPFAGFAGDYQDVRLLADWGLGLPALVELVECDRLIGADCVKGGGWDLVAAGHQYTMKDGDVPSIAAFIEHPAQSVTLRAYRVLPGGEVVRAGRDLAGVEGYVGRNSGGISVWTWDGTWTNKNGTGRVTAPAGRYVLEMTVVNALGDPANPDHVETWTSPVFQIDRAGKAR